MTLPNLDVFAAPSSCPDEAETLAMLVSALERYGEAHIDAQRHDKEHAIVPAVLEDLAGLGVFSASIPPEFGGAGMSLGGVCTLVAALARRDRAVATTVGLHLGLGTRGMVAFGSERMKARYLPSLAAGTRIAAFATTESGAGSDLAAIATRAEARDDTLRISGTKIYVTNGGLAGGYTILAATPGLGGARRGHSLIFLERDDEGLSLGPEEDKLGLRGSSTLTLNLEDLSVPMDRVIGEAGQGMKQIAHVLAWGRTAMAAGCCGTSAAALAATAEHVQTRRQFGRSLSEFDVVREQLADMTALQYTMEALVANTGQAQDDWELLLARSVAAKVFASNANWQICDTAVQLHGGAGFIEETGIPLLLRDARITRIFEGANDVLLVHAGSMAALTAGERRPLGERVNDMALAEAADAVHASLTALRQELTDRFGMQLVRQQRHLHRLGRLMVLREATDAAVLRACAEGTAVARAHARHWLAIARSRVTNCLLEPAEMNDVDILTAAQCTGQRL